jgi:hypothetical protein
VRIVYLDQNKWIDLARAVKNLAEKPEIFGDSALNCPATALLFIRDGANGQRKTWLPAAHAGMVELSLR